MTAEDKTSAEVARLRRSITRITNRVCVSTDVRYLRKRLADLQARAAAGEPVRHAGSTQEAATVLTASMPESARLAAVEMGDRLKIGTSGAVRLALRELAASRGWRDLVAAFGGES